ncbi:LysM peptidoglycan-binding domain-containing protein [Archangium violaceum]|uniref:LysM peptidoglycan-binding domain-containing protein n=1 Tax=Archangium violaceum TaxID=83451 RepID=UPI0036DF5CAF
MPEYVVQTGDSLWRIAQRYKISHWALIYWHPNNREFRAARPQPQLIMPGDKLYVPEPNNAPAVGIDAERFVSRHANQVAAQAKAAKARVKLSGERYRARLSETASKVELHVSRHQETPEQIAQRAGSAAVGLSRAVVVPGAGTVLNRVWKSLKPMKLATGKLLEVKWSDIVDTKGLKADWHSLWVIWLLELSPGSLGKWSEDGTVVEITSQDYISDLRSRSHHKKALQHFKREHPSLGAIKVGASSSLPFSFTGPGTATGEYTALEWFLGSYTTKMSVTAVSAAAREVTLKIVVENESHWESATRTPAVFRKAGSPKYFVADATRKKSLVGGDFTQRFIWSEKLKY